MTLKIKDKNYLNETVFKKLYLTRKKNYRGLFVDKESDPDPGYPKRPDPTGSGSATLVLTNVLLFLVYVKYQYWIKLQAT